MTDIRRLKRDPDKVLAVLHEMPDNTMVCSKACRIYVPTRFAEKGLAFIGAETYVIGIFAVVVEEAYGVMMVNAMMRIEPAETNRVMDGDDEYFEFVFTPGSVVIANLNLAKTDTLTYRIYDELIAKANVPWYLSYFDLAKLFDTARDYAGANIGGQREVTELLVSIISRNDKDRTVYYRQVIEEQYGKEAPAFVPLKDVSLSATNTTNKLGGGYFRTGTVSAIVSPSTRVERLEGLLFQ